MTNSPAIERYFACIGAQKAGTTWLARILAQHADVFVTPVKEIHYFDQIAGLTEQLSERKRRSRYRKYHQRKWTQWNRWREYHAQADWYRAYMKPALDDAWYASLFSERAGKSVAGELTPEYALIGCEGFRHMKRLAPDAHIIYIMRNPVDRAWSQLLHQCRVRKLNEREMSTDDFLKIANEDRFSAIADYSGPLADIAAEFAPSNVLLDFYEDIHDDRVAALGRVCDFLGVEFDATQFGGLDKRFNISQSANMPNELHHVLIKKYSGMVDDVRKRVGRVPEQWEGDFKLSPG